MNKITKSKIKNMFQVIQDRLNNAYDRWQDEKKYEDWNDYIEFLKNLFDSIKKEATADNAVFVKVSKKPFGLTFDFEGWQVVFYANAQQIGWKAKQL